MWHEWLKKLVRVFLLRRELKAAERQTKVQLDALSDLHDRTGSERIKLLNEAAQRLERAGHGR